MTSVSCITCAGTLIPNVVQCCAQFFAWDSKCLSIFGNRPDDVATELSIKPNYNISDFGLVSPGLVTHIYYTYHVDVPQVHFQNIHAAW